MLQTRSVAHVEIDLSVEQYLELCQLRQLPFDALPVLKLLLNLFEPLLSFNQVVPCIHQVFAHLEAVLYLLVLVLE